MRDQLQKLMTVRALRAKQRRRDYQAEREKLAAMEQELADNARRAGAAEAARAAAGRIGGTSGAVYTQATVNDAERQKYFYDLQLRDLRTARLRIDRKITAQRKQVEQAFEAVREAERSAEQLDTFDAELAEKEAREAELQEELQTETPPKPSWKEK
jgi:hypothetical protein